MRRTTLATTPRHHQYLMKLWRVHRVAELGLSLGQLGSLGQQRHESLLHLGVSKDGDQGFAGNGCRQIDYKHSIQSMQLLQIIAHLYYY